MNLETAVDRRNRQAARIDALREALWAAERKLDAYDQQMRAAQQKDGRALRYGGNTVEIAS